MFQVSSFKFHNGGFTLVELIISMGIIAILAVVSGISFVRYRSQQELSDEGKTIVTVLRNAQDRSIAQESGGPWGVHFVNDDTDYYELFSGSSYPGTTVSRVNLSSDAQFDNPVTSSTVFFTAVTGLPDASSTIKISLVSDSTTSSTINISTAGKIQY